MSTIQVIKTAKSGAQLNKASEAIAYASTLAKRELSAAVSHNGRQASEVSAALKSGRAASHVK